VASSAAATGDRHIEGRLGPAPAPIELSAVHKHWKGNRAPVAAGVDLTAEAGTLTWIGGRNGAGKTTLLRIAGGLIRPDAGTVRAYGLDPVADDRAFQRRVSFLTAGSTGLYNRLTARHQLEFQARICLLGAHERRDAVEREIERFDLQELADRRVERMSMGQRQRLRLALTLVNSPDVLLLDEPRTSLDDEGAALLDAAVAALLASGGAVLWCSPPHEGPDVRADRRLLLESGRLVAG
jgi:ABC-type multidrug transport system ATPase subunit